MSMPSIHIAKLLWEKRLMKSIFVLDVFLGLENSLCFIKMAVPAETS